MVNTAADYNPNLPPMPHCTSHSSFPILYILFAGSFIVTLNEVKGLKSLFENNAGRNQCFQIPRCVHSDKAEERDNRKTHSCLISPLTTQTSVLIIFIAELIVLSSYPDSVKERTARNLICAN